MHLTHYLSIGTVGDRLWKLDMASVGSIVRVFKFSGNRIAFHGRFNIMTKNDVDPPQLPLHYSTVKTIGLQNLVRFLL